MRRLIVLLPVAHADGTGLVQVTQDGGDDDPAWGTHPPAP